MNSTTLNQQKILEIENRLLEAMKKSDVEILEQLLHDDLLFVLPGGEVITKEMDLETHKSGNLVLEEITSAIEAIKEIGENVVVTLSSRISGTMSGQKFEGNFRYLRVWKIVDNQLKVIAGSCMAI
ncbi:nuclear transport factor 2 family protein [Flavobacterium cerinum]|uniref:Nuclear transport factor 2 family protein n=1 Tax=Flavobacterium cerinum TaxID=2502784 RepID=A0ABY5IPI4_9FLAO|nr:nuclear transport factor 2 family protein [Flavobacterium cerinum]UUC44745.1 nuclear transport factor 2 family protein [Flavobacterium cerinum]